MSVESFSQAFILFVTRKPRHDLLHPAKQTNYPRSCLSPHPLNVHEVLGNLFSQTAKQFYRTESSYSIYFKTILIFFYINAWMCARASEPRPVNKTELASDPQSSWRFNIRVSEFNHS